ncbi:hypothetical protein TNCV_495661 [Trichonephila clavipes]|nr:hypothetical protein TNCV_495661 [Trichonephila clavipes]
MFFSLVSGRRSLVAKVTDSWFACHEFEPSATEDPPMRGEGCQLRCLPRQLAMVKITRSFAKSSRLAEQCDVEIHSPILIGELGGSYNVEASFVSKIN